MYVMLCYMLCYISCYILCYVVLYEVVLCDVMLSCYVIYDMLCSAMRYVMLRIMLHVMWMSYCVIETNRISHHLVSVFSCCGVWVTAGTVYILPRIHKCRVSCSLCTLRCQTTSRVLVPGSSSSEWTERPKPSHSTLRWGLGRDIGGVRALRVEGWGWEGERVEGWRCHRAQSFLTKASTIFSWVCKVSPDRTAVWD